MPDCERRVKQEYWQGTRCQGEAIYKAWPNGAGKALRVCGSCAVHFNVFERLNTKDGPAFEYKQGTHTL
jgi:hypothetical protein